MYKRQLYHSVQTKLMGLPDAVRVFPAHGAGSACGKNLSTERQSTIGAQRAENYACQPMSEAEFVEVVTEGQPSAPAYFSYNASLNKQDRPVRELDAAATALSDEQVAAALADGALVLDARPAAEYSAGHLRGSVSVPADGRMAETVGMVVAPDRRVVLLAANGDEQQAATRLARIGFDQVVGYVPDPEGYLVRNADRVERASRLTAAAAESALRDNDVQLVDLRNAGELSIGAVPGAVHIPLPELTARLGELDPARPVLLYCAGGWRSAVGASVLRAHGFTDVSDLLGGYGAWSLAQARAS